MREIGVTIQPIGTGYLVRVSGRANFDYAVPVRELAKTLSGKEPFVFDLSLCTAMDSTFMGVLSMIGLKARRCAVPVVIAGAAENLRALLRGLGVDKLFTFVAEVPAAEGDATAARSAGDLHATAETVLEAHQSLIRADCTNAQRFEQVIEFAKADVDRLKAEKESSKPDQK